MDGVKIICVGTTLEQWENNPLIKFKSTLNEDTAEISKKKFATYKGLSFIVKPKLKSKGFNLIIRGSIAQYYNNGKDNAFDYDFDMLKQTINELCEKFNINHKTAIIQHLEIGVNISLDKNIDSILSGLIAYQNDIFTHPTPKGKFNGKEIYRQEYRYKIYDKGLMINKAHKNLLRIEFAAKSRKYLRKHNIEVLADILNIDNLNSLKAELIDFWQNTIFHSDKMQFDKMTNQQHIKWLTLCDPTHWEKINRSQRFRAKKRFQQLKNQFSTTRTQEKILQMIKDKFKDLSIENTINTNQSLHNTQNKSVTLYAM
ncbi:hypothetical protein [Kordia sp.]|uniref:hypothetical protein n=1 Tax=Kordia sp. TaxID=1965332 RepID=UPI003D2D2E90